MPMNHYIASQPLRPLRTLAPATNTTDSARTNTVSATVPQNRTSNACEACRRRKSKCNGVRPACGECAWRGIKCLYHDGWSPRALKRKLSDTEVELGAHRELFRLIQARPEGEALEIVRRIRAGADVNALVRHISDGDLLVQMAVVPDTWTRYSLPLVRDMPAMLRQYKNPYLDSMLYHHTTRPDAARSPETAVRSPLTDFEAQYRIPYHAAQLVDPRLSAVCPSKWTSVSTNDKLMRAMLTNYFHHQYIMTPHFHKDQFLDDMLAGRRRFCSQLLVNALLALACQGYVLESHKPGFWDPQTLLYQFSAEARRLWEVETYSSSLPTIHAGLCMSMTANMNANDKVGWSYLSHATAMAKAMDLFGKNPPTMQPKMRAVRTFTACVFSFHFFRYPLVDKPPEEPLPPLAATELWYPEIWVLYPSNQQPVSVHVKHHFKAVCEMRTLLVEAGVIIFARPNSNQEVSLTQIRSIYVRFVDWYNNLPEPLSIHKAVLPHQLLLHMHYFNLVILMFDAFVEQDKLSNETLFTQDGDDANATPEVITNNAKIRLETLFRLYYLRHGWDQFDPLITLFHAYFGFLTAKALSKTDGKPQDVGQVAQSALVLVAQGLRTQARYSYFSYTIFTLLRDAIQRDNPRLLHEVGELSTGNDEEAKVLIAQHAQSLFPISIANIAESPGTQRVESLIAAYREMSLDGSDSSQAGDSS